MLRIVVPPYPTFATVKSGDIPKIRGLQPHKTKIYIN